MLKTLYETFHVLLFIWVMKCLRLSFVIWHTSKDFCFKGVKCVSITIVSSNINDVTGAILNSFIQSFNNHKKAQNELKKSSLKASKGKIVTYSLICVLCFCPSVFVPFSAFSAFGVSEIFSQKKKKSLNNLIYITTHHLQISRTGNFSSHLSNIWFFISWQKLGNFLHPFPLSWRLTAKSFPSRRLILFSPIAFAKFNFFDTMFCKEIRPIMQKLG